MNWTVMTARLRGQVVVIDLAWASREREADELSTLIVPLLEQGFRKFLLNLVRIRYLDSADLGALLRVSTIVTRNGGKLSLLDPPGRVRPLLEIARLASLFDVFTSEDEAVHSSDGLRARPTVFTKRVSPPTRPG
jgi:anti-anti-sigma factor